MLAFFGESPRARSRALVPKLREGGVRTLATWIRRLQGGSVHLYLLYVATALLAALAAAWWSR